MLDLGLLDSDDDGRGSGLERFGPVAFLENAESLGDGLVEALRADLDRVIDALPVSARHPACSDCHAPNRNSFVIYSPWIRPKMTIC